jgi:hypothetical protein
MDRREAAGKTADLKIYGRTKMLPYIDIIDGPIICSQSIVPNAFYFMPIAAFLRSGEVSKIWRT